MQVVYHAKDIAEAERLRDYLVAAGIATHVSDRMVADKVRVLVDNRCADQARRAIAVWLGGKPLASDPTY
jgi:hypothetical protein